MTPVPTIPVMRTRDEGQRKGNSNNAEPKNASKIALRYVIGRNRKLGLCGNVANYVEHILEGCDSLTGL